MPSKVSEVIFLSDINYEVLCTVALNPGCISIFLSVSHLWHFRYIGAQLDLPHSVLGIKYVQRILHTVKNHKRKRHFLGTVRALHREG